MKLSSDCLWTQYGTSWNKIMVLIASNISTVSVAKGREKLILHYCEIPKYQVRQTFLIENVSMSALALEALSLS